jgi:hypothetical protein
MTIKTNSGSVEQTSQRNKIVVELTIIKAYGGVMILAPKALFGILCFSVGGTLLMFVVHFMLQGVYVSNIMDWVSFWGWMTLFSFVGFLLLGSGLMLIIKNAKAETR